MECGCTSTRCSALERNVDIGSDLNILINIKCHRHGAKMMMKIMLQRGIFIVSKSFFS